jgi:hypothetical protein
MGIDHGADGRLGETAQFLDSMVAKDLGRAGVNHHDALVVVA